MEEKFLREEEHLEGRSCLNRRLFSFSKRFRILSRSDFLYVSRNGRSFRSKHLVFVYCFGKLGIKYPRLGVTVSKKYGNAVARNRFKRLVRENFRVLKDFFPTGIMINVFPVARRSNCSYHNCKDDFSSFVMSL